MKQEVYFKDIRNVIINNLLNCNYDLKIAVAWFTDDKILSIVNNLLLKGVTVSLIIYDDHINRKELFERIHYNNASVFLSRKLMHNKFCVIDNKTVINGSYNWTNSAKTNDENIQITFNNETFANNFIEEFNKISSNCKSIDEYFKHSISNIKNLENEFELFFSKWTNYKFPYFFSLKTFIPSKINSKLDINGYVYLIKNNEEERNFLWLYFLSQTNCSVIKILNLRNEKIIFPLRFNNLCLDSNNKDNVTEFLKSSYIVEEHIEKESSTRYFLSKINKDGQLSDKIEFSHRISNQSYLFNNQNKSYYIDKDLDISPIDYTIEKVIALKDEFNRYMKAKLMVVSDLSDTGKSFGLMDVNNKILIPILYDKYVFNRIWLENLKDLYIDFIEFPILEKIFINSIGRVAAPVYDNNQQNGRFKPFVDRIYYRYSVEDCKLIEKFILNHNDIKQTRDSSNYYFLSDENYKYKDFYLKVKNFRFRMLKMKYTRLDENELYFTTEEFQELKKFYNYETKFNYLTNKYQNDREKLLIQKEKVGVKLNEGGCYIATMVYGDYNHPDVLILRNFRDSFLNKILFGVLFIKVYYKYSPRFVKLAKKNKLLSFISKKIIYNLVSVIKKRY